MVREAVLYLVPDTGSQKLERVSRGREVAIIEKSREWLHVFASVGPEKDITGWILDKGVVRTSTPDGDRILFGEAVDSEAEASRRGGRRDAAQDAQRLYARMAEYFPQSPLAGEALYRAADIRWQLEREDVMSRPSWRRGDPNLRSGMEEEFLRRVIKKYPHTRWADLAAFDLIDNKLCGDWQGLPKCPEKESEVYEKYAAEHPQSPKTAEALYEAARRQAALIEIYKQPGDSGHAAAARNKALELAKKISAEHAQTDWASRALRLAFLVEQNVPTYGNATE